jgi:hypothetical protein
MGKGHMGCAAGEFDSLVVDWMIKRPNYITVDPGAIIARMFKRKAGDWLKIFEMGFFLRKGLSAFIVWIVALKWSLSISISTGRVFHAPVWNQYQFLLRSNSPVRAYPPGQSRDKFNLRDLT